MGRPKRMWKLLLGGLAALAAIWIAAPIVAGSRGADGRFEKRTSAHFVLHQDVDIDEVGGFNGSRRFEDEVLGELERAYDALEEATGLRPQRRLEVVIDDPGLYDQQFAAFFRFQSAGFYAGFIRVRGDTRLTAPLSRTLHHELFHAALDAVSPSVVYPAWVNEGTAEWFEYRTAGVRNLPVRGKQILAELASQNALMPMQTLSLPNYARLDNNAAQVAYLQSYAMIDYLVRSGGERSLPRFLEELVRSRDPNRALQRVYRLDVRKLEEGFLSELR
ncbi:MAG TPA: hypothetical protein VFY49_06770 [Myxococcota bacterium]|nr:hypothetical protein [Myxococcota bacterium]